MVVIPIGDSCLKSNQPFLFALLVFLVMKEWTVKFNSSEAATRGVLLKKVFLEISQNSQENTYGRLWHRFFPMNFTKF